MKRWIVSVLAGTLVVSALAIGGGKEFMEAVFTVVVKKEGFPVVDRPIYLEAVGFGEPDSGEWNSFGILKNISDKTNVMVNFQTVAGDGAEEKLDLILASENLPDVLFSGLSDQKILSYARKGIIRPLEDLIDEYAPNIGWMLTVYSDIRKAITAPDGHIYSIPSINEDLVSVQSTTLNINKGWLYKLGLEAPTTTDEIPFTYEPKTPYNIWNGDTGLSGAFGVTDSDSYLMRQGNTFIFTPASEGWKEYVKWTGGLYADGLIDPEIFTQDHNQYMSKISSDRVGAYLTDGPVKTESAEYIAIEPLKGPNGDQIWSSLDLSVDKNRGMITTSNPYPEATMRYIDSFYEPITSLKLRHGIYLKKKPDVNMYDILSTVPGESPLAPGACVPVSISDDYIIMSRDRIESDERKAMYAPFLADPIPLINFTAEESRELSSLKADIADVVDENKARWTTNQADIDQDWDAYIEYLNFVGMERYVEIYNAALERYENN